MKIRKYNSYEEYLLHQMAKSKRDDIKNVPEKQFELKKKQFVHFFHEVDLPKNMNALCLGARRGEEVEALIFMGHKAIGIDLVPFPPNVIQGDFQNIPFKKKSFNFIFSNTIDHVCDVEKFSSEVKRVLKKNGLVLFHLALKNWSKEMALGLDSPNEFLKYFKEFTVLKNQKRNYYGGGLNWLLFLRKN